MQKLDTKDALGTRDARDARDTIDALDTFEIIYARILSVTNCITQKELSIVLEISQSSISDAKRRGLIPDTWLIILFDKFRLNPDYLRYGTGKMYINML